MSVIKIKQKLTIRQVETNIKMLDCLNWALRPPPHMLQESAHWGSSQDVSTLQINLICLGCCKFEFRQG